MKTENTQNVFSISITHNSKIRELNDGNRVIVCQTTFLSLVPPFLSYELWKLRIELRKQLNQTASQHPNGQINLTFRTGNISFLILYFIHRCFSPLFLSCFSLFTNCLLSLFYITLLFFYNKSHFVMYFLTVSCLYYIVYFIVLIFYFLTICCHYPNS